MKDLEDKNTPGIEVAYAKEGISVSQRKFALDLLKETWKLGFKAIRVQIVYSHRI